MKSQANNPFRSSNFSTSRPYASSKKKKKKNPPKMEFEDDDTENNQYQIIIKSNSIKEKHIGEILLQRDKNPRFEGKRWT